MLSAKRFYTCILMPSSCIFIPMRNTRIYHPDELATGQEVELEAQASTHLTRVLRAKEQMPVTLFDGSGSEYAAHIIKIQRNRTWVRIKSVETISRESPLDISLAQGISRGERMDYTIQKAVELGVSRIIPLFTERSIARLKPDRLHKRQKHWHGVAVSACEQCGRNVVPDINEPDNLDQWVSASEKTSLRLIMDPEATVSINDTAYQGEKIILIIGPEGGLSDREIDLCRKQGFTGVRMGPRVLRTETAALTALSLIQGLWGDLD